MIYLDHHAATPLGEPARRAMEAAAAAAWANPSSVHAAGRAARALLERAREQVAAALGARPAEVVLTSGGTEACDLAIGGLGRPERVVSWRLAHPAVLAPCATWESAGVPQLLLDGLEVPADDLLEPGTLLVVPWVGHETGNVLDLAALAERAHRRGARVVVDANQALGRLPFRMDDWPVAAVAIASHKIGGPAGAGALVLRRGLELAPRFPGGGQERGRRGGSPGVAALVGFGAACGALADRLDAMPRVAAWRDRLEAAGIHLGGVVNGAGPRVASVTNLSFRAWKSAHLVAALDLEGLATSAGAACSSGLAEPSPGVAALHPDEPWRAASALRLSLGPEGLDDDAIDRAVAILERVVPRATI